jgi:hypothetical protein
MDRATAILLAWSAAPIGWQQNPGRMVSAFDCFMTLDESEKRRVPVFNVPAAGQCSAQ